MALKRITLAAGVASCCAFGAAALFTACGDSTREPNELMVAVDTTGPIPTGGYQMYLSVSQGDTRYPDKVFDVGSTASDSLFKLLPATLGVTTTSDTDTVTLRLMTTLPSGTASLTPLAVRTAVVGIPKGRIGVYRMPIDALCFGAPSVGADAGALALGVGDVVIPAGVCGSGTTCIQGSCQPDAVDAASLPTFDPSSAFGGDGGGSCFSIETCFRSGATAQYRAEFQTSASDGGCSVTLSQAAAAAGNQLNVGIPIAESFCSNLTDSNTPGVGQCVVPLDSIASGTIPVSGWSFHPGNPEILDLPPGLCATVKSVVVSTNCTSKVAAVPVCGIWSSVGHVEGADGGTAIMGDVGDGSVAGDATVQMMDGGFGPPVQYPSLPPFVAPDYDAGGKYSDFTLTDNSLFTAWNSDVLRLPLIFDAGGNFVPTLMNITPFATNAAAAITQVQPYAFADQLDFLSGTTIYSAQTDGDGGGPLTNQGISSGAVDTFAVAPDGVYYASAGHLYSCPTGTMSCTDVMVDGTVSATVPLIANDLPTGYSSENTSGVTSQLSSGVFAFVQKSDGFHGEYAILHGASFNEFTSMDSPFASVNDLAKTDVGKRLYYSGRTTIEGSGGVINGSGIFYTDLTSASDRGGAVVAMENPGPIAATSNVLFYFYDGLGSVDAGYSQGRGIYACTNPGALPFGTECTNPVPFVLMPSNAAAVVKMRILGNLLVWSDTTSVLRGYPFPSQYADP